MNDETNPASTDPMAPAPNSTQVPTLPNETVVTETKPIENLPVPFEKTVLAEPSEGSSLPTEHEQPIPQPSGTPLMSSGLLPATEEAPSEEAMAYDHDIRKTVNLAEGVQADTTNPADLVPEPAVDDQGRTTVGVTSLVEAHKLPEIDADEHAEPFEGQPRFIRAFKHTDGRTMRVVHHDDGLAAQEIKD